MAPQSCQSLGKLCSQGQLIVLLCFLTCGSQSMYLDFFGSSSRCTRIPRSMALCYDIGYSEMRIPNLLEHDTMAEVIQQSSSWLPLLARECHPDARIFLCSLFAPICLDRYIYPCRSLCEAVRGSCAPIMACYGYPWPEILRCDKFPEDHGMCISPITNGTGSTRRMPRASCRDCELEEASTAKEILDTFCDNDFVAKVRITKKNITSANLYDFDLDSKLEILKHGSLPKTDVLPRLQQWLDLDATCVQNIMRGTRTGIYVIGGEVQEDKVVVNNAYAWQKKNKNLQFAVRKWKNHKCRP
ncbi:frizzled related protein 2 isoform X1 [Xenopus tropicalis]|uniref:Secreted frizzled-related protein 1 n=2 Tax=Xenopus tropicalis TaxID=8364 RepID=Q28IW4_XENTR|nr:frizzled related protein 2 isoform X1 [Xenopus tropicalis]CAJ82764.1 frizzled related protein 2, crescent [Xenopus tropicalis]|eukprot:XP_012816576.1 PREDICTED: frizzled-related protein 2 isoform X1 [Xenopus tropicalis]